MRSEIEHNEERRMQVEHHKSSRKTIPFPDQHASTALKNIKLRRKRAIIEQPTKTLISFSSTYVSFTIRYNL